MLGKGAQSHAGPTFQNPAITDDGKGNGGRYKDRTCDPYHVKVVLYR